MDASRRTDQASFCIQNDQLVGFLAAHLNLGSLDPCLGILQLWNCSPGMARSSSQSRCNGICVRQHACSCVVAKQRQ